MPPLPIKYQWFSMEKDLDIYDQIQHGIIKIKCRSPMIHRFWSNVDKNGPIHLIHGQCWMWFGHRDRKGYGVYGSKKLGKVAAHRYSYKIHYVEFDDSLWILHKCDNPSCIRPEHLFIGTHDDNMKDMISKGRGVKGMRQGRSKLTDDEVREIRESVNNGRSWSKIAKDYNIHKRHVGRIMSRYAWKHI